MGRDTVSGRALKHARHERDTIRRMRASFGAEVLFIALILAALALSASCTEPQRGGKDDAGDGGDDDAGDADDADDAGEEPTRCRIGLTECTPPRECLGEGEGEEGEGEVEGNCTDPGGAHALCNPNVSSDDDGCSAGLECLGGVCGIQLCGGVACSDDEDCRTGPDCADHCVARGGAGARCGFCDSFCEGQTCCDTRLPGCESGLTCVTDSEGGDCLTGHCAPSDGM